MPVWIWCLLVAAILVMVARYVGEGMVRMGFYVLALIVAVYGVVRLTGIG